MGFYNMLSLYYDDLFPPATPQINWLKELIKGKDPVLDIGAGTGGYAAALAAEGLEVQALELGDMVPLLQKRAEEVGFKAFEMDMKHILSLNHQYNSVYCIGNTLVHLVDEDEVYQFFRNVYGLLRPHGVLGIQIVNYDRIITQKVTELPLLTARSGEVEFRRYYELNHESVIFKTQLKVKNELWEAQTSLLALKKEVLARILKDAGFNQIVFEGDFNHGDWSVDSSATIAKAVKW